MLRPAATAARADDLSTLCWSCWIRRWRVQDRSHGTRPAQEQHTITSSNHILKTRRRPFATNSNLGILPDAPRSAPFRSQSNVRPSTSRGLTSDRFSRKHAPRGFKSCARLATSDGRSTSQISLKEALTKGDAGRLPHGPRGPLPLNYDLGSPSGDGRAKADGEGRRSRPSRPLLGNTTTKFRKCVGRLGRSEDNARFQGRPVKGDFESCAPPSPQQSIAGSQQLSPRHLALRKTRTPSTEELLELHNQSYGSLSPEKIVVKSTAAATSQHANKVGTVPRASDAGFANTTKHVFQGKSDRIQTRLYHTSARRPAEVARSSSGIGVAPLDDPKSFDNFVKTLSAQSTETSIRDKLRRWQQLLPESNEAEGPPAMSDEPVVALGRLQDNDDFRQALEESIEADGDDPLQNLDQEEFTDQDLGNVNFFSPGDLVEIRSNDVTREAMLGVWLRNIGNKWQVYLMNGKFITTQQDLVPFYVSRFVQPELLEPILALTPGDEQTLTDDKAYVPDVGIPRKYSAPVVSALLAFWNESQSIYRKNASVLDNIYQILAHPTDLRFGTLEKIAQKTIGNANTASLPPAALYAVHKALLRTGVAIFTDRRSHRQTGVFRIRPLDQVEHLRKVQNWVREFQEDMALHPDAQGQAFARDEAESRQLKEGTKVIVNFVQKARRIINESRKSRSANPSQRGSISADRVGSMPSITDDNGTLVARWGERYNDDEVAILKFLDYQSVSKVLGNDPMLQAMGGIICKAVNAYDGAPVESWTAYMLLQELGVITPWENTVTSNEHLLLPTSNHSRLLAKMSSQIQSLEPDPNTLKDSMAHLRHDWGNATVYCIDDASAAEIDDGVSLERIPDSADCWVHIHVANPSAFLERDHILSRMAAHMTETVYMPERNYTMLPAKFTRDLFSLRANRPTLTFSARLDPEANIVETKVRSGIIRNVVNLTPKTLNSMIGVSSNESGESTTIVVGGNWPENPPSRTMTTHLPPHQKEELVHMQALALKLAEKRISAGAVYHSKETNDVSVCYNKLAAGLPWMHPSHKVVRRYEGDPVIKFVGKPFRAPIKRFSPHGILVQGFMVLAGEIAAIWCNDRNIPSIYRGTFNSEWREVNKAKAKGAAKETADIPFVDQYFYLTHQPAGLVRPTPLKHRTLGIDKYSKVTSPLRRYGDMVIHWQIEAALRYEALKGSRYLLDNPKAAASNENNFLPFSINDVAAIIQRLGPREKLIRRAQTDSARHWIAHLFARAYYDSPTFEGNDPTMQPSIHPGSSSPQFNRGLLPQTFKVIYDRAATITRHTRAVMALDWSVGMFMRDPIFYDLEEPKLGDVWEVKIETANQYTRSIFVEPVKLVSRADEHGNVDFSKL